MLEKKSEVVDERVKQFYDMYLVSKERYFDQYFGEYVRITRERLAENYYVQQADVYYKGGKEILNEKVAYGKELVVNKKESVVNFGKGCVEICENLRIDYMNKVHEFYDNYKREKEILRSRGDSYKNKFLDDANEKLEHGKEEVKILLRKGKEETKHILEKGETIWEQTKENLNGNSSVQKGRGYVGTVYGYYTDLKESLYENYQVLYNIWTKEEESR